MLLPTIFLSLLLSLTSAFPQDLTPHTSSPTFLLNVLNACPTPKSFALYRVNQPASSPWTITETSTPVTLLPGQSQTFLAPYLTTGLRLSGHAERGVSGQWTAQALFEFGFSSFSVGGGARVEGTAYDLSVMEGAEGDVGVSVEPEEKRCWRKVCRPGRCARGEGWTREGQKWEGEGSEADTGCYFGKTDFRVVWCA